MFAEAARAGPAATEQVFVAAPGREGYDGDATLPRLPQVQSSLGLQVGAPIARFLSCSWVPE